MKIMYAVVFFLVVVTSASLVLSVSLNNDENQDIVMVVDDATSMHDAGKVQVGQFLLEDGKVLTLARKLTPVGECYGPGEQCGALHWCCEGVTCDGWISGTCKPTPGCYPKGSGCGILNTCCYPYKCTDPHADKGICS